MSARLETDPNVRWNTIHTTDFDLDAELQADIWFSFMRCGAEVPNEYYDIYGDEEGRLDSLPDDKESVVFS